MRTSCTVFTNPMSAVSRKVGCISVMSLGARHHSWRPRKTIGWYRPQSLAGNPYDSHTLLQALIQARELTGFGHLCGLLWSRIRGHGIKGKPRIRIVGKLPKWATESVRRWMKRRSAIELIVGHLKSDHRLSGNFLQGNEGDRAKIILSAAVYNLSKLLTCVYCACALRLTTREDRQKWLTQTEFSENMWILQGRLFSKKCLLTWKIRLYL